MKTAVGIGVVVIGFLVLALLSNCAIAACPPADLNGDCLVNFLDFEVRASQGSLLELQNLAEQWLEFDAETPAILSRVDKQPGEPDSFAVELVVVGKQRVERTVFQYECQVILTNLSGGTLDNAQLVMTARPENITIIEPQATFGGAQIAPAQSATSIDTCTFTVDRSIPIDPLEIVWSYITAPQDMTFIPGGTFKMGDRFDEGDSDELPVHTVTLDSFYMGSCEVTNRQYCDYLNSALGQGLIIVTSGVVYKAGSGTGYPYCDTSSADSDSQISYSGGVFSVRSKNGRNMSNDPMVTVSWYGAAAYCNWRSREEEKEECYNLSTWDCDFSRHGYRLATEAEWEYAARGGLSSRRFPWGDTITHSQANYYSDSSHSYDVSPTRGFHPNWYYIYPYTSPGGSFAANNYGLYDMAGNVYEWCNDWYSSYPSSPTNNPTGPITGMTRIVRGGCWYFGARLCRVADRRYRWPDRRNSHYSGIRVVVDFQ